MLVAAVLMLVLAAPKSVPAYDSACPDPPPYAPVWGPSWPQVLPCDSLTSPILENPQPSTTQAPAMPVAVLLIGFMAGAVVVIVARSKVRRRAPA
jgi:hypothetical protein